MPLLALRLKHLLIGASMAALATGAFAEGDRSPTTNATTRHARAGSASANPPVVFAQAQSDLPADPAVRFGRLPNGMTYVIYKNKTPPGAASVWMRVAAGSVMEEENQRGLAHFIEHMAFNGSKNVPEGEMIKHLERDGLQFGADTNAQTTSLQTVYMLNVPDASQRVVDDALFLLRETAGNITFKPAAIDRERGVILGEERARASAGYRAYEANIEHVLPGSKYAERMPIGLIDIIKNAQRPEFVRFYNDFYRPEYTTVIVVGDVDPDRIEAAIRQRFSDWHPGPQSPAALTDYGKVIISAAPRSKLFVTDGVQPMTSVSWVKPPEDTVETKAKDFSDKLFSIANGILDDRFARVANSPTGTFLGAGLQKEGVAHTAQTYSLAIVPKESQDKAAFEQAVSTLREYLSNGPTQPELDRALAAYDRRYQEGAAAARTIPSRALASLVVDALATQGVVQSPAQSLAQWQAFKPAVTKAAIVTVLKPIMAGAPPALWRQDDKAGSFDQAALLTAWQAASGKPMTNAADLVATSWPYTDFGKPSAVVSRQTLGDTGATRVTFANGVVLTVKHTAFEANAVHVAVLIGNGLLGVRPDQGASLFMAKQIGPLDGGLGKMSSDDVREALAGKVYGLGMSIGNNATLLGGSTTTGDLTVQMQLMSAFITDPGLRSDAFDRTKAALPSSYRNDRSSPDGVFALEAVGDLYNDDPRFTTPSLKDALDVTSASVSTLVRDQLRHGPVEVTIVGDISDDEAIRQVAATLGALPPLPPASAVPNADYVHFPTANLHRTYFHDGRADQNLSAIAWPTADYSNARRAAALELLASIMTLRELDQVREKQGSSYSASANSAPSRYFPGFGYIISRAMVRPEVDETYYKTVSGIVDDLKRKPVTADEMTRARLPLIDRLHNDKNGNAYWLALLSGSVRDPKQIATIEGHEHDLLAVTTGDIEKAAISYLNMDKALRIQIKSK